RAGRLAEADTLLRQAVEVLRSVYPQGHTTLADVIRFWALNLAHETRYREAQAPFREVLAMRRRLLGPDVVNIGISDLDLAYTLAITGDDYHEAEALSRDALRIFRQQLGDNNALTARARTHLGDALRGQGRLAEAEPLLVA